jgi:hypothetical protein
MMIFYLQQVNPPVVPVLQEMHNGTKPEVWSSPWQCSDLAFSWPPFRFGARVGKTFILKNDESAHVFFSKVKGTILPD